MPASPPSGPEPTVKFTPHKGQQPWDRSEPTSILSSYDLDCLPYAITNYLHNVTGIPHCDAHHSGLCQMCGSAVRLVLDAAEKKIIETAIHRMAASVGLRFIDLHPPTGDD